MKAERNIVITGLLAILIIAPSLLAAEEFDALKLPQIERKSFLNGMQTLFFDNESDRSPFLLMIENGAAFDPSDKWGATYVMVQMLLDGLSTRNYRAEFEAKKIDLAVEVDWDAIYLIGSAPVEELEFAMLTLADLVVNADFAEEAFERIRNNLLTELRQDRQDIEKATEELFISRVFGQNPYGHGVRGSVETVEGLLLRDVKIQARKLLLPNQTRLALYYTGDRENLFRRMSRRWGTWVRQRAAPFTFRRSTVPDEPQIVLVPAVEQSQSLLRWGYLGVERSSRDYFAFKVLEQYLTLSLPDWAKEVAAAGQIRGCAYLTARKMPGYFQVTLRSRPEEAPAYMKRFQSALQEIRDGKIEEKRFMEAKLLVLQEFQQDLVDPILRLRRVLSTELYDLGLNFIPTFALRLERVTPESLQGAVNEAFPPAGFVAVVAAPNAGMSQSLGELGKVEVLN